MFARYLRFCLTLLPRSSLFSFCFNWLLISSLRPTNWQRWHCLFVIHTSPWWLHFKYTISLLHIRQILPTCLYFTFKFLLSNQSAIQIIVCDLHVPFSLKTIFHYLTSIHQIFSVYASHAQHLCCELLLSAFFKIEYNTTCSTLDFTHKLKK